MARDFWNLTDWIPERQPWAAILRILMVVLYPIWSIPFMIVGSVVCVFWLFGPLIYIGLPIRYFLGDWDLMPLVFIPGVIIGYYFHAKLFYETS